MAMPEPERSREYRNHHLDSSRWDNFVPRDDDIVVTTAYKAGTTWTQRAIAALLFGPGPLEQPLNLVSPWLDARFWGPVEPMLELLDAQPHRRFIKSHLAADGLRYFAEAKYVVVGRDTRDVFMSLFNHYAAYTDLMMDGLNSPDRPGAELPRCPATPRELWPRWIREGWFEWEPDGWPFWSHHHHLSTWWQFRDLDNVHLVHYADLKSDLVGELQRLAAFLDIDVEQADWPAIAETLGLDAMRDEARGADDPMAFAFEGGAARFFYKGDAGRWRHVLTDEDLAMYDDAAATLEPDLRVWLEGGRHALGRADGTGIS